MITVVNGVNEMNIELANKTVGEITESVSSLLNLSGDETAKLNGIAVDSDTVVESGDTLEFVKEAGKKGAVEIASGVNEMSLDIAGKTVGEITETVAALLNLSGDESVKLNGVAVDADTIVEDGDTVEFVKEAGKKGSVEISSGVNEMSLDLAGRTIGEITETIASLLNLSGDESVKLNGVSADADDVVQDGDTLEFVKEAGKKGSIEISSGVNEMSLDIAGKTVGEITDTVSGLLNLSGDEVAKLNGVAVDDDAVVQDGDTLEFVKEAGKKGVVRIG